MTSVEELIARWRSNGEGRVKVWLVCADELEAWLAEQCNTPIVEVLARAAEHNIRYSVYYLEEMKKEFAAVLAAHAPQLTEERAREVLCQANRRHYDGNTARTAYVVSDVAALAEDLNALLRGEKL